MGLENYLQARGAQPPQKAGEDEILTWNEARDRHQFCAEEFEKEMAAWSSKASPGSWVDVTTVRFYGKKRN